MPSNDLLTQEELDALLREVQDGTLLSNEPIAPSPDGAVPYEFWGQEHIVRGPLPTLEMIYDRFTRHFNSSLFNLLSRETTVDLTGVDTMRFADYSASLPPRSSLQMVYAKTLQGVMLFVIEARLISIFVDGFFGGSSESDWDNSSGELTVSEMRISRMIVRAASDDLTLSWEPVHALGLDTNIEATNPYFLNIASPRELIVVARFRITIGSKQGDMQIAMPYSVIEPIKELLETGIQSDRIGKETHWKEQLKSSLNKVKIDMKAHLVETELSLGDILMLRPGDVIPVDIPEQVSLCIENMAMFRGAFGISRGHNSIMITQTKPGEIISEAIEGSGQND